MCYGLRKNKTGAKYHDALFLAPFHCHSREACVKMKMFLARSPAKMADRTGFYRFLSLRVRKFSLEKNTGPLVKRTPTRCAEAVVIEGKDTICILPAEYGKSALTVSVTSRPHTFVNVCVRV